MKEHLLAVILVFSTKYQVLSSASSPVIRNKHFLGSRKPVDKDAESTLLWVRKYTQLFFTPSYPATSEGLGNYLRLQYENTSLLFKKSRLLYEKLPAEKYDFLANSFEPENPLKDIFNMETQVLEGSQPLKVSTVLQHLLLRHVFSLPRDEESSPHYHHAGTYLFSKLGRLGLFVQMQRFDYNFNMGDTMQKGVNVVGILPGVRWGTSQDQVVVVSAHWDTVKESPGVNDNGSGVVALVEIARIIMEDKDMVNTNSVIFAAFDKEESGCQGSKAFVRDIVVPEIVGKYNASIRGVYNLDTILGYSRTPGSQDTPEVWSTIDHDMVRTIEKNGKKGDFILTVGRDTEGDTDLARVFAKYLEGYPCHHLRIRGLNETMPGREVLEEYIDMWRSDHVRFWYHNQYAVSQEVGVETQYSFSGILISDTADNRGYMRNCYHQACDTIDNMEITEDNMEFLAAVTQAVAEAVKELATDRDDEEELEISDVDMLQMIKTTIHTQKKPQIPMQKRVDKLEFNELKDSDLAMTKSKTSTKNMTNDILYTTNEKTSHHKIYDSNNLKSIRRKHKDDKLPTNDEYGYKNLSKDLSEITYLIKDSQTPEPNDKHRVIQTNYESVGSQVNIGTLHLTINSDPPKPRAMEPMDQFYLLNMPMDRLSQLQSIISRYYQDQTNTAQENSPMVLKLKSDL